MNENGIARPVGRARIETPHPPWEQDKAMLEMAEDIARLKRTLTEFRAKLAGDSGEPPEGGERPPHY